MTRFIRLTRKKHVVAPGAFALPPDTSDRSFVLNANSIEAIFPDGRGAIVYTESDKDEGYPVEESVTQILKLVEETK